MFAYRDAAVRREHWFSRPFLAVLVLAGVIAPLAIPLSNKAEEGYLRVGVVQGDIALPGPRAYSHPGEVTSNNMRAFAQPGSRSCGHRQTDRRGPMGRRIGGS